METIGSAVLPTWVFQFVWITTGRTDWSHISASSKEEAEREFERGLSEFDQLRNVKEIISVVCWEEEIKRIMQRQASVNQQQDMGE